MKLAVTQEGAVTIVAVEGRIDTDSCEQVESALTAEIGKGATRLVVDLGQVDYISSAGLRSLLIAAKRIKAAQGRMALCNLQPLILDVFQASGFASVLTVRGERAEAVAACRE